MSNIRIQQNDGSVSGFSFSPLGDDVFAAQRFVQFSTESALLADRYTVVHLATSLILFRGQRATPFMSSWTLWEPVNGMCGVRYCICPFGRRYVSDKPTDPALSRPGIFRSRTYPQRTGSLRFHFFYCYLAPKILQNWCETSWTGGRDEISLSTSVQNIFKKNEKKACQASKTPVILTAKPNQTNGETNDKIRTKHVRIRALGSHSRRRTFFPRGRERIRAGAGH
jgi:hypothetical protein